MAALDRTLAALGLLASKSAKLSPAEKRELRALAGKAGKSGRQGLGHADRARTIWLIRKAAPERMPNVDVPPRLRKLLRMGRAEHEERRSLRSAPATDPLDRLEKLGSLRGKLLTQEQFEAQRARILAAPAIGSYIGEDGSDPLDRLSKVSQLREQEVLTAEQAADLTEQILGGA